MASSYPYVRNLGYFDAFMRNYGRASEATRQELYRDCQAYTHGAETAADLYAQTCNLIGACPTQAQINAYQPG